MGLAASAVLACIAMSSARAAATDEHQHHHHAPAAPASAAAKAAPAVGGNSIYQLATPLTDQGGRAFALADQRGGPMIVSMFYTSCQFVCPMLIDAIRATEQKLSDAERQRLKVLLVSFDPARDSVEALAKTAAQRRVETPRWTLARTDAAHVRKLAALLDIQYRALDNGDFNHSTVQILVDADGRIVGRTGELAAADPAFVKLVKTTLANTR